MKGRKLFIYPVLLYFSQSEPYIDPSVASLTPSMRSIFLCSFQGEMRYPILLGLFQYIGKQRQNFHSYTYR